MKSYNFDFFIVEEEQYGWMVYETTVTGELSRGESAPILWQTFALESCPSKEPPDKSLSWHLCTVNSPVYSVSTYLSKTMKQRKGFALDVASVERDKPCGKEEQLRLSPQQQKYHTA